MIKLSKIIFTITYLHHSNTELLLTVNLINQCKTCQGNRKTQVSKNHNKNISTECKSHAKYQSLTFLLIKNQLIKKLTKHTHYNKKKSPKYLKQIKHKLKQKSLSKTDKGKRQHYGKYK